jgi:hypothetical protein
MPLVARNQQAGTTRRGDLEEWKVIGVGEREGERGYGRNLGRAPNERHHGRDVLAAKPEPGSSQHFVILRDNAIVREQRQVTGEHQVYEAAGGPMGIENAGDEDIGVEDDAH